MDIRTMLIFAEEMPGDPRVADYGALVAAEARHSGTVLGDDIYPTIFAKAAALLHGLLRVEALDARNRTFAWVIALRYLALNGAPVPKVDPTTAGDMLEATQRGDRTIHELAAWLRSVSG
jgi:prophage maintenance system killer protein